jgi:hypothetical protein
LFSPSAIFSCCHKDYARLGRVTCVTAQVEVTITHRITKDQIILVDKNGVVKYGADRFGSTGEGINVTERDYFKWAKSATEGGVHFVEPYQSKIGFTSGSFVISAVSPLFKDGKFNGAFVTGFLLSEATQRFLEPLKITDDTRIYLMYQNGVILFGPVKELVGINYLDYMEKSSVPGKQEIIKELKGALNSDEENKLDIVLPNENKKGALTRYLVAYAPVIVGDQHWTIGVATPVADALEFLTPFYFKEIGILGLLFAGFLVITIRVAKIKGWNEGVGEEHKIHSSSTPPEIL